MESTELLQSLKALTKAERRKLFRELDSKPPVLLAAKHIRKIQEVIQSEPAIVMLTPKRKIRVYAKRNYESKVKAGSQNLKKWKESNGVVA